MRLRELVFTLVALSIGVACGTQTKQEVANTALTSMPTGERVDTFEATARVLDEHPELVDEFYAVARNHPRREPRARSAALVAVRENRGRIIELVKSEAELAKDMAGELLKGLTK